MALRNWPTTLPARLRLEGLAIRALDPTIETNTDAGPKQRRRKYTQVEYRVTGTLVLASLAAGELDRFWRVTLAAGVHRFNWTHPRTGERCTAQFVEPPQMRSSGRGLWIATLSVRVWL